MGSTDSLFAVKICIDTPRSPRSGCRKLASGQGRPPADLPFASLHRSCIGAALRVHPNMPHYYSGKQDSAFRPRTIASFFRGREFTFRSASGVFSKDRVDRGTSLLAEAMLVTKGDKALDIGCGIGILGIVASSLGASVTMTDVNERAIALSRKNVAINDAEHASVVMSDLYTSIADDEFDAILSNPPQSAGKDVFFAIIER